MKHIYIPILFLLTIITSCSGEFIPTTDATINLIAPKDICEEGTVNPSNPDELNVVFTWSTSENEFEQGNLILINEHNNEILKETPVNVANLTKTISLPKGFTIAWKIEAPIIGGGSVTRSNELSFFSEITLTEGTPYPVEITEILNNSTQVNFSWESPLEDPLRDNLRYKTYYTSESVEENTTISELAFTEIEVDITSSTPQKRIEIPTSLLENGINYFKVESILSKANNIELKSSAYFKFIVSY